MHPMFALQVNFLASFHFFRLFTGILTYSGDGIWTGRGELCGCAGQLCGCAGKEQHAQEEEHGVKTK